jgi:hypothetical protein
MSPKSASVGTVATIQGMSCPTCTQLDRDEVLISEAIEERREALRAALDPELRDEVAIEEAELAALLQKILERRAA